MAKGLDECLTRLKSESYSEFIPLASQIASLQEEIERLRLRDGPTIQSAEQVQLQIQKKRLERLYLYHHHRNDWAVGVAKGEIENFIHNWLGELLVALQSYTKLE